MTRREMLAAGLAGFAAPLMRAQQLDPDLDPLPTGGSCFRLSFPNPKRPKAPA